MSYREKFVPSELLGGEFLRDNVIRFSSIFVVGVVPYIYRVALGQILDPAAFGLVATLLSTYHLLGVSHALSDRNVTLVIADDQSDETVGAALLGRVTLSIILFWTLFVLRNQVAAFLDVPVALVSLVFFGAGVETVNARWILHISYKFAFISVARVLVHVMVVTVSVLGVLWTTGWSSSASRWRASSSTTLSRGPSF